MERIKKIFVSILFEENEIELGELVWDANRIYFRYYFDFVKACIEISPIKLKLNNEINIANQTPFDGLFGVFADSLPDGWGRLLLNRSLASKGVDIGSVTPLDRLSYIGSSGMGALIYKPEIDTETQSIFLIELDKLAKAANQLITGPATEILDKLFQLGGSSGGARPKILVGYNPITHQMIPEQNTLPEDLEHWIIKFPSSYDRPDIANIEYAYYKMALDAGIEMSESRLFNGKSGQIYFGTKRFDRDGNKRLHLHSAAGMMHDNFRLSAMDYGNLMDCAFLLERDVRAYEKILRLAAFNVFAHNRDDHSKNISFLMDSNGTWKVAPAYDLTFSNSAYGMHSTMVAGESANPSKKHLMDLASYFKVKNAGQIIDEVQAVVLNWKKYAEIAEVRSESMGMIDKVIGKSAK